LDRQQIVMDGDRKRHGLFRRDRPVRAPYARARTALSQLSINAWL
jgi:hypothetical protein